MQAVIMAGGKGTRLSALTKDAIPKPMVPILGKPLLEWQVEQLRGYGITDIIMVIGHLGEKIRSHFGDGGPFGVRVRYIEETQPLGTAGAFYYLKEMLCTGETPATDAPAASALPVTGMSARSVDPPATDAPSSALPVASTSTRSADRPATDARAASASAKSAMTGAVPAGYFLLLFGDVFFDVDLQRMERFHVEKHARATLFVHPNNHPFDSDLVRLDDDGRVTGFDSKNNNRTYWYDNCVNGGIYILDRDICDLVHEPVKTDLEKDILFPLVELGQAKTPSAYQAQPYQASGVRAAAGTAPANPATADTAPANPAAAGTASVYGYRSPEYIKDVGTVERVGEAIRDIESGLATAKCLKNRQKCIFLDRDGTINRLNGLVYREEDFELEPCASGAIGRINTSGYLAIVVTNQPVVARGLCTIGDVENIHRKLSTLLGKQGIYLDDVLFCPHHPDRGYPEENPLYKIPCDCRKPATGMIEKAARRYHIDLSASWMVGDTTMDIQTGKNAGLGTALVLTGEAGRDGKYGATPDMVCADLADAVERILAGS
ncbi:MAG: HAD-IIIA family hydrolase [Lachnospiraceae bacterium]|nr:HAD-IIIA family hydrolase [Lachnospiraceae bacterium]